MSTAAPEGGPLQRDRRENLARAKQTLPSGFCAFVAADVPAPQRLPDLRPLPHHPGVPAAAPRPAQAHARAARRRAARGPPAAGRDERARESTCCASSTASRLWRPSMAAEPLAAAARAPPPRRARPREPGAGRTRRRRPGGFLPSRRAAGHVSRPWLDAQPELRGRIDQLRDRRPSASTKLLMTSAPASARRASATRRCWRQPPAARREPDAARRAGRPLRRAARPRQTLGATASEALAARSTSSTWPGHRSPGELSDGLQRPVQPPRALTSPLTSKPTLTGAGTQAGRIDENPLEPRGLIGPRPIVRQARSCLRLGRHGEAVE